MLIGIIGAPNKGKSLLFSTLTLGAMDISHEALEADERAVKKQRFYY